MNPVFTQLSVLLVIAVSWFLASRIAIPLKHCSIFVFEALSTVASTVGFIVFESPGHSVPAIIRAIARPTGEPVPTTVDDVAAAPADPTFVAAKQTLAMAFSLILAIVLFFKFSSLTIPFATLFTTPVQPTTDTNICGFRKSEAFGLYGDGPFGLSQLSFAADT